MGISVWRSHLYCVTYDLKQDNLTNDKNLLFYILTILVGQWAKYL